MRKFIALLERLDAAKIYYRINKVSENILVEVAVPGQRWEIEFDRDDNIQIEKFISEGKIYDEDELCTLFRDFSD